jgi:FAD binding domain-containing protein
MANMAGTEADKLSSENRRRHPDRKIERAPDGRIRTAYTEVPDLDAEALLRELEAALKGEVRFDTGSRALYATDSSNYRQVPIGVVIPKTREDVVKAVEICRRHHAPVLPRGGGTSLAGECCNTAVVIDFSKYLNRVLEIDSERHLARVEPGCILDHLQEEAAKYGLTFGPDPATHDHNTLGGMIGNNSGPPTRMPSSPSYGPAGAMPRSIAASMICAAATATSSDRNSPTSRAGFRVMRILISSCPKGA